MVYFLEIENQQTHMLEMLTKESRVLYEAKPTNEMVEPDEGRKD